MKSHSPWSELQHTVRQSLSRKGDWFGFPEMHMQPLLPQNHCPGIHGMNTQPIPTHIESLFQLLRHAYAVHSLPPSLLLQVCHDELALAEVLKPALPPSQTSFPPHIPASARLFYYAWAFGGSYIMMSFVCTLSLSSTSIIAIIAYSNAYLSYLKLAAMI